MKSIKNHRNVDRSNEGGVSSLDESVKNWLRPYAGILNEDSSWDDRIFWSSWNGQLKHIYTRMSDDVNSGYEPNYIEIKTDFDEFMEAIGERVRTGDPLAKSILSEISSLDYHFTKLVNIYKSDGTVDRDIVERTMELLKTAILFIIKAADNM